MDIGGKPGYLIVDYPNPRGLRREWTSTRSCNMAPWLAALIGIMGGVLSADERPGPQRKRAPGSDRDDNTKWRTEADIKLESIDVNWKPQVNQRLKTLDARTLNLDKQLVDHNKAVIAELRKVNEGITNLGTTVALAVQAREYLEERVEKLEDGRK